MSTSPAPTRGTPLTLDGQTYYLRYSFATRRKMIEEFGGEEAFKKEMTGDKLPKILWYGLATAHPDMTVEQLEELIDLKNLEEVCLTMLEAIGYKGKFTVAVADAASPGVEGAPTEGP